MWLDGLQGELEALEAEVVQGLVDGVGDAIWVGSEELDGGDGEYSGMGQWSSTDRFGSGRGVGRANSETVSPSGDQSLAAGLREESVGVDGEEEIQARIEKIEDEVKRLKSEKKGLKKRMKEVQKVRKEQEKAGRVATEISVRDDGERSLMLTTGSSGPQFLQDTVFTPPIEPRRCSHNLSTTVEDGSSSNSREKTLANPYVSNEPYPPPLPASTRDVRIENADDVEHIQEAVSWHHEEEQRRHKFTDPSQDQVAHDEQHYSSSNLLPGSYIHIALPPRFTFPTLDDSFVVFSPPTSVFHFPRGATREQLLSLIEHRRSAGQTSANGSIVHIRDMGYEVELRDAIAKLLRSQERDGHVPLGDMWEIGQGDTFIVHGTDRRETVDYMSGPEDQEQIPDCGGPDMRGGAGSFTCPASPSLHDEYFASSKTRTKLEAMRAHRLSTGNPSSPVQDKYFAHSNTPVTLAGMRVYQDSTSIPPSNQADEFKWMQEAHKFQLGWEQLRQLYCNLMHENDSLRQRFQTADKEAAEQNDVMQSTLRRLDFWIDEARNARKREKLLVEYVCELERVGQMWMRDTATADIRGGFSQPESHVSADLDLDDLAQDFKAWKGPLGSGIDGSSIIAKDPETDEPNMRDVEPLGFYFFPSVSTIVLHTEPLSYIQFPHRVTLTDIRRILAHRKTQGMEDNAVLVRVRDILEFRDEMGIPDPELSDDRQILICVPAELEPDTQKPGWDRADEAFQHRYNVLEKQYEADLFKAINVLRGMRGLSYLTSDDLLITGSDSEGEKRYHDIGELINQLNQEISLSSGSDSMWSEQSAMRSSVSEEERRRQLDTAYSRGGGIASPYHIPGTHDRDLTPPPHTVPDMFTTQTLPEWTPVPSEYSCSVETFRHPKGQGCETWAGRLDPSRNQCTYCHLPFAELEPRDPPSSYSSTTVSDEDQVPSLKPCLYVSPLPTPFADCADSSAEIGMMGESFPFKVCTNPYAVPPFSHSNPPTSSVSPLPFGNLSWTPPSNNINPQPPRDTYRRAAEDSAHSDTSSGIYVDSLLSASSSAYISTLLEELTLAEQQQNAVTQNLRDMQDQQKQLREEIKAVRRENEELREDVVQRAVSPLRRARGGGEVEADVMDFVEYVIPPPSPVAIGLASMAKSRIQAASGLRIDIGKGKAAESASTGMT
jgi:hypothetical protein